MDKDELITLFTEHSDMFDTVDGGNVMAIPRENWDELIYQLTSN